jgi:shikimate kinase
MKLGERVSEETRAKMKEAKRTYWLERKRKLHIVKEPEERKEIFKEQDEEEQVEILTAKRKRLYRDECKQILSLAFKEEQHINLYIILKAFKDINLL